MLLFLISDFCRVLKRMFSFGYFPGVIQPLKMDLTEGSETSPKLNLTLGKYQKENIQATILVVLGSKCREWKGGWGVWYGTV
jgi:hypothetical protein